MTRVRSLRLSLLAASLAAVVGVPGGPAWAGTTAGPTLLAQQDPDGNDGGADQAGDPSQMLLRVGRLETEIRTLRGRVEELQHQNEQLQDNLRKLSQDVDFRFQELQDHGASGRPVAAQRRGDVSPDVDAPAAPAVAVVTPPPPAPRTADAGGYVPLKPTRSGDAFDPDADPAAPGAPKPLGTTPPSAPLDLMRSGAQPAPDADAGPSVIAAPPGAHPLPGSGAVASLVPGGTREEFETGLNSYKQGQYDSAATGLQSFVDKYPRDRMVPDAVYLMGESFSRLGRHREAAEQFLKLSTDYPKAPRAPDALLKLGVSLDALGAKEQACATFQEVTRKYPAASPDVRAGVDREMKRAHCRADG